MAFALSIDRVEEALKKAGCPICRLGCEAAARQVDTLLYEYVNDAGARQPLIAAYGMCPEHTRLLAAAELSSSGAALGINIIYEQLARKTAAELKRLRFAARHPGRLQQWLNGLLERPPGGRRAVLPAEPCPVCASRARSELNYLEALFEVLEQAQSPLLAPYRASDGLCLAHLRAGLDQLSGRHPAAARLLAANAAERLEGQSAAMLEYIRKSDWAYRDEQMTPAESAAWRKTLTFFTGLPGKRFSHRVEEARRPRAESSEPDA